MRSAHFDDFTRKYDRYHDDDDDDDFHGKPSSRYDADKAARRAAADRQLDIRMGDRYHRGESLWVPSSEASAEFLFREFVPKTYTEFKPLLAAACRRFAEYYLCESDAIPECSRAAYTALVSGFEPQPEALVPGAHTIKCKPHPASVRVIVTGSSSTQTGEGALVTVGSQKLIVTTAHNFFNGGTVGDMCEIQNGPNSLRAPRGPPRRHRTPEAYDHPRMVQLDCPVPLLRR